MGTYIATDEPHAVGWSRDTPASRNHEADIRAYGPPPRNFKVLRQKQRDNILYPRYIAEGSTSKRWGGRGSWDHPCSPAGLKSNPPILNEYIDDREEVLGFAFPPIVYEPGSKMKWKYARSWQGALAVALNTKGALNSKNQKYTAKDITEIHKQVMKDSTKATASNLNTLYHPGDRKSMVFKGEGECAIVARQMLHSLILICPFVQADGVGYKRIWNTHNRPPIRARWSTGQQGLYPPLVLGCIPQQQTTTNREEEVLWYAIVPDKKDPPDWAGHLWGTIDVMKLAATFGFPDKLDGRVFMWTVTYLHFKSILGYSIPDDHLGCWLWQYGGYLNERSKLNPASFVYNADKLPEYKSKGYRRVTRRTLTAWMTNNNFRFNGVVIREYAIRWDTAITARIRYQQDTTDANWTAFGKAMHEVSRVPCI